MSKSRNKADTKGKWFKSLEKFKIDGKLKETVYELVRDAVDAIEPGPGFGSVMKDIVIKLVISVVSLLLTLSAAHASALRPRPRSAQDILADNDPPEMHLADGILRDLMMYRGDHNGDDKLSASEITWFYRHIVQYPEYVAKTYGDRFISIADQNGDHLLDRQELLSMLVAMNAVDILKR